MPRSDSGLAADGTTAPVEAPGSGWLRLVVDSMGEGFSLIAPDFTILELNREALRIDGRPRDALIGRSYWIAYPGTEHSEIGSLFRRAMAERIPVELEHEYHWPDGRLSWFETRACPVDNGCIAIFHRDVTDRRRADRRLRASEQRFKAAVQAIEGVLWTNDADGRMRGEQAGWAALTGQAFAQYQGYGWADAVHPEDAQPTLDAWQAAVAACTPFEFEHRVRCHDGVWRLFAIRAVPTLGVDGEIVEWVGVHRDITEFRQSQDLLARNAETFTNLVVSNPFGIYVVDADFRLIEISLGAQPVFANIDPLIGRDFGEVIRIIWPEEFATEVIRRFRHTLATGEPYVCLSTVEQRANIDAVEAYDWRIERITLTDGRNGVVCYFYDLSERNAYEARLKQLLDDKDLLAREIDHRVKNSLTIVASFLAMQRRASGSPETAAALDLAADRVLAVARVHELLHRSHRLGEVAFGAYLEQMCDELRHSLGRPGVELSCLAAAVDLPAQAALSLGLIANELVTNAFKHGCAAGATRIVVELSATPETLTLCVSDNGGGLANDVPARQSGLGLKLVTSLARQLNAAIDLPPSRTAPRIAIAVPGESIRAGA